jgi:hypothetical protein
MYRTSLLLALLLLAGACSGTAASTTTAPATTTTTAPTTVTTTSSEPPTSATTPPAASTVPASGTRFETAAGTPPAVFDSYRATLTISMDLGEATIELSTDGIWTGSAISCTITTSMAGFGTTQQVITTPDATWVDTGTGLEPVTAATTDIQDLLQGCPASPLFWQEFVATDLAGVTGESGSIGGRPATKADLTESGALLGELGGLGAMQGSTVNQLEMWIDDETGVLLAMTADVELNADALGDIGATPTDLPDSLGMVLDLEIGDVNDPSLTVSLP